MALDAGTRFGPYEIVELLGAGGMGEVYLARDTRLDRSVALKVSAERFSDRFEREARVISSLNHPHICTLYDVGPNFLVMELVEGETLAERIARGPVPLDEALPMARQIAEALEAAHEKGVIHRDLKPANIKITPNGEVKVLDFGLAKVAEAAAVVGSDPAASPTLTIQGTRAGMLLGTAAYMPPEQARGAVVDKRADVWAFGCVFFEMLAGKRVFEGDSTTDVLAAVVRAEPDWRAIPSATPEPIKRLLKRCLEKDRRQRLPDIGVARLEIDDARITPEKATAQPRSRSVLPWFVAAIALLAAAGAVWWAQRTPEQEVWTGMMVGGPAKAFGPRLSPDGQLLAFLAFVDQLPQLAVMKPNGGSWTVLTSDREHGYIATTAWAPDGSKIYFDRLWGHPLGIYSVPPLGGEVRLLLEDAFGPEPLPDGSLIVVKLTDQGDDQLFHYWPDSGKLEPLPAFIPQTDITPMLRAFPDGKELVYYGTDGEAGRSQSPRLYVYDLALRRARELTPGVKIAIFGTWAPLDVASDGKSVYTLSNRGDSWLLLEIPRKPGNQPRILTSFARSATPVAMDAARDGSLYLDQLVTPIVVIRMALAGGIPEEFPAPASTNYSFTVLPGGDVAFVMTVLGRQRLAVMSPGHEPHILLDTPEESSLPGTIFDGKLAFNIGSGDQRRIALASLRDGRILQRFSTRSDVGMSASPDGKTLYYSFGGAIWAQPVAGGDPKRVTEGIDVVLDPAGQYLHVKRSRKGVLRMFRLPAGGGTEEELQVPADYHIANPPLSPAAVDARGRILVSVATAHSFYYRTALIDPANKSFTIVPAAVDGDAAPGGWAPDGKIVFRGARYLMTLWRYQRSKGFQ